MIELQLLTGMRPGEVVIMRACDLSDLEKPIWKYTPFAHKTEGHEIIRQIPLGPKAQQIIKQFLTTNPKAFLFSPADAIADQRAARREDRETPLYPSHLQRDTKDEPQWEAGLFYGVDEYRRAISRACDKAMVLPPELKPDTVRCSWPARKKLIAKLGEKFAAHHAAVLAWYKEHRFHPHQLRHNFATEVRKKYGLDVAQVLLGHTNADVTEIYAERDFTRAAEVAGAVG
jgi:integrase